MAGWFAQCGEVLLRVNEVRGCGGWFEGLSIAEDLDLWLRLALRGPFVFTGEPVVAWRMHAGQWQPKDAFEVEHTTPRNHVKNRLRGRSSAAGRNHLIAREALESHDAAWREGRIFDDLRAQAVALRRAPSLWWSPLTRRQRWRYLLRAVVACLLGSRRTQRLRRARAEATRAAGRAPGRQREVQIVDKSGRRDV